MKTKMPITTILVLIGLFSAALGAYYFGITFITPNLRTDSGLPPLLQFNLPSQTQNGFTVSLESYYADATRLIFCVRLKEGKGFIDNPHLIDENGAYIGGATENGPQTGNNPSVDQIEFNPTTPFGDHFKGKLDFVITAAFAGGSEPLAHFYFDLNLPVHPALTFEPKQTIFSFPLEVLLDRVVITPAYTQVYLCYQKPDNSDWMPGYDTTLKLGDQQARMQAYNLLFDSTQGPGAGDKGGEPDWIPPVQNGRCVKLGFPIGDAHPQSLTLSIPTLEQSLPELIPAENLTQAYSYLESQGIDMEWHIVAGGAYPEYKKLPAGMTEEQAYRQFIEGLGYVYNSQWKFDIQLYPSKASIPIFSTSIYGAPTPIPISDSELHIISTLPGRISSFDICPDSKTIAIATTKGAVLYDLTSKAYIRTLNETENIISLAWSSDGTKLAVGGSKDYGIPFFVGGDSNNSSKAHLIVWDTTMWKVIFEPEFGNEMVNELFREMAWSPDNRSLAISTDVDGVLVFDTQTGKIISRQKDFAATILDLSWSPDGSRLLATGDLGYGFRRWRIDTNESVRLYDQRINPAEQLAWSPDGKRIASVHDNGYVCFWTADTNQCDSIIHANTEGQSSLAWSPDGSQLATGGDAIRTWDTQTGKMIIAFGEETNDSSTMSRYTQLVWRSLDSPLASLEEIYNTDNDSSQNVIRLWDVKTGKLLFEFRGADDNSS